jgi:hypothetical protein
VIASQPRRPSMIHRHPAVCEGTSVDVQLLRAHQRSQAAVSSRSNCSRVWRRSRQRIAGRRWAVPLHLKLVLHSSPISSRSVNSTHVPSSAHLHKLAPARAGPGTCPWDAKLHTLTTPSPAATSSLFSPCPAPAHPSPQSFVSEPPHNRSSKHRHSNKIPRCS